MNAIRYVRRYWHDYWFLYHVRRRELGKAQKHLTAINALLFNH